MPKFQLFSFGRLGISKVGYDHSGDLCTGSTCGNTSACKNETRDVGHDAQKFFKKICPRKQNFMKHQTFKNVWQKYDIS